MQSNSSQSDAAVEIDRRNVSREPRDGAFTVWAPDGNNEPRKVPAWPVDGSEDGLGFRCGEILPDRVRVEGAYGTLVTVCIVRRQRQADGLWEYGGVIAPERTGAIRNTLELTDEQIHELAVRAITGRQLDAARTSERGPIEREFGPQAGDVHAEDAMESLRTVSRHSARSAIRLHRAEVWARRARISAGVAGVAFAIAIASLLGALPGEVFPFIFGVGSIAAIEWLRSLTKSHRENAPANSESLDD